MGLSTMFKENQTRSRQGQAQEFVIWIMVLGLLLWTQNDSGLLAGPLTITHTLTRMTREIGLWQLIRLSPILFKNIIYTIFLDTPQGLTKDPEPLFVTCLQIPPRRALTRVVSTEKLQPNIQFCFQFQLFINSPMQQSKETLSSISIFLIGEEVG